MPIYDYKCLKCHSEFEKTVKVHDAVPVCPECGSEYTEKQVSAPKSSGIVLKGEGFYKKSPSSW